MKAHVQNLTLPENRRILAVSDIHGNLPYLRGLLEKARFSESDVLVIVGDLLEKGPQSLDTLRFVMELGKKHEVHTVCGNCDWWFHILYTPELIDSSHSLWYINHKPRNLARQRCEEIGYKVSEDMDVLHMRDTLAAAFPAEFEFLSKMPEVLDAGDYVFATSL